MGMKTILLSVVLAHLCAATINDTVTVAKHIGHGFPIRLVFNITDEEGPTPQTIDTSFLMIEQPNEAFVKIILLIISFMAWFFILTLIIGLPLNVLALVTFTCQIQEKKPAVIYMTHLACADLLLTLLLPLKIHYYLNLNWAFGEAMCRVVTAAYYFYMYCSVQLMMSMSVDRMLGVVFPIAYLTQRSARTASRVCVLVWILNFIANVPFLFRELTHNYNRTVTCEDSQQIDPQLLVYMYIYPIFICTGFFLPLVVTLVNYFTIIYVLLVKSDNVSSSSSSSDQQKKAIIMAINVLIGFVVCFVPSNVILLYLCFDVINGNNNELGVLYCIYRLTVCLGNASAFLNPLLYYYGSSQYRKMIRSVLKR